MEDILDQWIDDPIGKLNLLNQLIPRLIETFDKDGTDGKKTIKKVISAIESIREVLEDKEILKGKEYAAIMDPEEALNQEGVSTATDKAKAAVFICKRINILLSHICMNATAKNVKEIIRVIMPFVQGALEYS